MKNRTVIALALMIFSPIIAWAQTSDATNYDPRFTLPMTPLQVEELQMLVECDPEAATQFEALRKEARTKIGSVPQPLAVIHYEGLSGDDRRRRESVNSLKRLDDVIILVQYWQARRDLEALETIKNHLIAWAGTYIPTGNDVNETKLLPLFTAFHETKNYLPAPDRSLIADWLLRIGELQSKNCKSSSVNARFVRHARILAVLGFVLERTDWQAASQEATKKFVNDKIRADGITYNLDKQSDLGPQIAALRPLIRICKLTNGADLYAWKGSRKSSIKGAVNYVIPYIRGTKTEREWLKDDADRQIADRGGDPLFHPYDVLCLLEEASALDPSLIPLLLELHPTKAARYPSWTMVMHEACQRGDALRN